MRPHEVKSTIRAGIFVTILVILASSITFFIGKESAFFEAKGVLFSLVKNAQGIKIGAPVFLHGIKIGRVQNLNMKSLDEIVIEMQVVLTYLGLIKTDSMVSIKTQGMLGDKTIEILGGDSKSEAISDKGFLKAEDSATVSEFINKGENIFLANHFFLQQALSGHKCLGALFLQNILFSCPI